jgi:hypothetical protein
MRAVPSIILALSSWVTEGAGGDVSLKPLFWEYIGGATQHCCQLGELKIAREWLWPYDNFAMVRYLSSGCKADIFKPELEDNKFIRIERRNVKDRAGNIGSQLPLGGLLSASYEADCRPPQHQSDD